MGYYIEVPSNTGKALEIQVRHQGQLIPEPLSFAPPAGQTLVCVVANPLFEAAAIVYSESEFTAFSDPEDPRPREWLLVPTAIVKQLNPRAPLEVA